MKKIIIGNDKKVVSQLVFGTLPMGPLQANVPENKGTELLLKACDNDINIFDTAELYRTYTIINNFLKQTSKKRNDLFIISKSAADSYEGMKTSINKAIDEMNCDYLDLMHIHAAKKSSIIPESQGAIDALLEYKEKGLVRNIGLACHSVAAAKQANESNYFDVLFALLNYKAWGILDGRLDDMENEVRLFHEKAKKYICNESTCWWSFC